MFNPGDIIFFKEATKTTTPLAAKVLFKKGHGYGVLLGITNAESKEPTHADIRRILTRVGLTTFDDVIEFLGKPAFELLVQQIALKYAPPKSIVTPNGAPIITHEEIKS